FKISKLIYVTKFEHYEKYKNDKLVIGYNLQELFKYIKKVLVNSKNENCLEIRKNKNLKCFYNNVFYLTNNKIKILELSFSYTLSIETINDGKFIQFIIQNKKWNNNFLEIKFCID